MEKMKEIECFPYSGKELRKKIEKLYQVDPAENAFINIDKSKCNSCGKCIELCPVGCIEMDSTGKATWAGLTSCAECGTCWYICPSDAIDFSYPDGGKGVILEDV